MAITIDAEVLRHAKSQWERWKRVQNEWDADKNVMPLACDHPPEMHDGYNNEYDASQSDMIRAVDALFALVPSNS